MITAAVQWKSILILHLCISILVFAASSIVAYIWYIILIQPDKIEDAFTQSETLQLLQIIIGFTYIGVIRSFFETLREKTEFVANMMVTFDFNNPPPPAFTAYITNVHIPPHTKKTSWQHWEKQGVDVSWKPLFHRVILMARTDHGQLFSFLGPWTALGIFYLFHPPVAYRDDADPWAWAIIYSASITVLFSFLGTMWVVERYAPVFDKHGTLCEPLFKCTVQHYIKQSTAYMLEQRPWTPASQLHTSQGKYNSKDTTRSLTFT